MAQKNMSFFKVIAIVNIFIIGFLYADLYLPSQSKINEIFDRFDSTSEEIYGRYGKVSYQYNYFIVAKSGKAYPVSKLPAFIEISDSGKKIIITETPFLGKVKTIDMTKNNVYSTENVSFLSIFLIEIFSALALIISFLYVFYPKSLLTFLLAFATIFIYITAFGYIF